MASHNRNPKGNNQHAALRMYIFSGVNSNMADFRLASAEDETLIQALREYHRENLSSNKKIAERLWADHKIGPMR